ncbi:MAG: endonuclease/exonuclease/phosphatase family protein, partial [Spirochaetes bacterium]|nr:endonuclease/exonuclease/phosphatase family protein [Spirochaetota bacterium]
MKIKKIALTTIVVILILLLSLSIFIYSITMHPPEIKKEAIIGADTVSILEAAQQVKVLSWNVQYMAGKEYVFWYDELDNSGPDIAPSRENI